MSKLAIISKRLTIVNSLSSVGVMAINSVLAIWMQQFLLKRVSPEEYSLIAVLNAIMVFLPLVSTIFTSAIGRYIIESLTKNDEDGVTRIVSTIFPFLVLSSLIISVIGAFAIFYIDTLVKIAPGQLQNARLMLAMMFGSFVARLLLAPFSLGLYVQQKMVLENSMYLGVSLFKACLLVFLLVCINASVVWVVFATTVSELTGLSIVSLVSINQIGSLRYRPKKFTKNLLKPLVSFGGWNVVGQLGSMIRTAADPLILNRFATAIDVTSFYFGSLPDRLIRSFMSAAMIPIIPQLTAMHAENKKDSITRAFLRLGRMALWLVVLVILPLFIFGNEIFAAYLKEKYAMYASSTTVMILLLAYLPIAYSITGLNSIVIAVADNKMYMIYTLLSQIVNLVLTFLFIVFMRMGAVGSALATFIAGILVTVLFFLPLSLKMTGITIGKFITETLAPGLLPGFVSAGSFILMRYVFHPSSWIGLGACVGLGSMLYIVVLCLFCLKKEDKADLKVILEKIHKRPFGIG
jgi:O-antigen/teichoic acid export membrane protein